MISVAIDGPAGAGKSTVAKAVAKRLNFLYIDTGAMYRTVAYAALKRGIGVADEENLTKLAAAIKIDMAVNGDSYKVFCDGQDVSELIRTPEVGAAASPVSAVLGVREHLVAQQQRMAENGKVVMDGRDIGTKVLPNADCKIFLTASIQVRARRRWAELCTKGIDVKLEEVATEIEERDYRDSHRVHSPLVQAPDAILLDTSDLSIEEVIEKILELAGAK